MPLKGTIIVDENLCKACELCIEACPQHVIALDDEKITPRGFHPAYLAEDGCTGCGICALVDYKHILGTLSPPKPKRWNICLTACPN